MIQEFRQIHNLEFDTLKTQGIIAIVDDDPNILHALGTWLELYGLRATSHTSAESLLQLIHRNNEKLTVSIGLFSPIEIPLLGAVLDINLPGISGIDLASSLRKLAPGLPVAIITALREEERTHYGKLPLGIPILKKPFDLDALEDALRPMLN